MVNIMGRSKYVADGHGGSGLNGKVTWWQVSGIGSVGTYMGYVCI